jgi:hypothetical protein
MSDRWFLSLTSEGPRTYLCPILIKVLVECLAVYDLPPLWPCILGTAMDERVEDLLADVLALEGEDPNAIREGVRGALADCEQLFRAQEVNKRMRDKAAHACHALFRARLVEEMRFRKGTSTVEHLKLVLSIIDGPRFPVKR